MSLTTHGGYIQRFAGCHRLARVCQRQRAGCPGDSGADDQDAPAQQVIRHRRKLKAGTPVMDVAAQI